MVWPVLSKEEPGSGLVPGSLNRNKPQSHPAYLGRPVGTFGFVLPDPFEVAGTFEPLVAAPVLPEFVFA